MGMAKNTRKRGREQAGMSREGQRTMEKVLENTVRDRSFILYRNCTELSTSINVYGVLAYVYFALWGYLRVLPALYILYRTILQFHFLQMDSALNDVFVQQA